MIINRRARAILSLNYYLWRNLSFNWSIWNIILVNKTYFYKILQNPWLYWTGKQLTNTIFSCKKCSVFFQIEILFHLHVYIQWKKCLLHSQKFSTILYLNMLWGENGMGRVWTDVHLRDRWGGCMVV